MKIIEYKLREYKSRTIQKIMLPDIVGDHVALAEVTTEGQEGVDFKPIAIDIDTTGRRLCDKVRH